MFHIEFNDNHHQYFKWRTYNLYIYLLGYE